MSEWYDPDGRVLTDTKEWSDRRADGTWDREHLETKIEGGGSVSTVWLGLDHSWGGGPPLIFETMPFVDGPLDQTAERYATREQAHAGHERMVERIKAERKDWRTAVVGDAEVAYSARRVAAALTAHVEKHAGEASSLGDLFDALVKAVSA